MSAEGRCTSHERTHPDFDVIGVWYQIQLRSCRRTLLRGDPCFVPLAFADNFVSQGPLPPSTALRVLSAQHNIAAIHNGHCSSTLLRTEYRELWVGIEKKVVTAMPVPTLGGNPRCGGTSGTNDKESRQRPTTLQHDWKSQCENWEPNSKRR